jgi:DNA-binding PadR family transcriptional regulator
LAAVDRAYRHRRLAEVPGVSLAVVKTHLGLAPMAWSTNRLDPDWYELERQGLVEHTERRARTLARPTSAGEARLHALRNAGELEALPESPQHRDWREARSAARERIGGFRDELRAALVEASGLLDAQPLADSDSWREARQRLQKACSRLGSAVYCLCEWAEPDDSEADIPPEAFWERRDYRRW